MESVDAAAASSLDRLYRTHRVALFRLAYLLTSSRELAEDAVQAAFVALGERQPVHAEKAYLRRVVVNRIKDAQRRSFRRRPLEPVVTAGIPEIDETWQRIARLPRRQRAVVVLRFYEDLRLVDIAELLDRPVGTVRSDLHRALRTLKEELT